jgi:hypothetical protein
LAGGTTKSEVSEIVEITMVSKLKMSRKPSLYTRLVTNHAAVAKTVSKKSLAKYANLKPVLEKLYLSSGSRGVGVALELSGEGGTHRARRRRVIFWGSGGMPPGKNLKLESLKCHFLHFRSRVLKVTQCHKISQIVLSTRITEIISINFVVYY